MIWGREGAWRMTSSIVVKGVRRVVLSRLGLRDLCFVERT